MIVSACMVLSVYVRGFVNKWSHLTRGNSLKVGWSTEYRPLLYKCIFFSVFLAMVVRLWLCSPLSTTLGTLAIFFVDQLNHLATTALFLLTFCISLIYGVCTCQYKRSYTSFLLTLCLGLCPRCHGYLPTEIGSTLVVCMRNLARALPGQ